MKSRWSVGLAVVTVALALTACSSSPKAASPGTPSSSTPIVVGTICSCSGPYAGDIAGAKPVITAWEKWTNAHGGINGHPVKVIVEDDSGIVANGVSDAKQLVEQDHVSAAGTALTRELISAERKFIHALLRDGKITDETRRRIERDLDLEEASLANREYRRNSL